MIQKQVEKDIYKEHQELYGSCPCKGIHIHVHASIVDVHIIFWNKSV